MKKKILIIIIFIILFGIHYSNVYAFDTSDKVYDYADVISSEDEEKLKSYIDDYIEKYNMDMVLVTVKQHDKSSTKEYAMDFYDYNGFGLNQTNDGIIMVIDFSFGYRDIYISTTGEAIRVYDDYRIDNMLDNIGYITDKEYYYWFESFINDASDYADVGVPESNRNTYIDENGNYVVVKSKEKINYLVITIISLIVPSIVVGILISKNRMIRKASNANLYIQSGNTHITTRNDRFLTTHTTSVRITDSTSHSSGGGGSSISHGSSGISHGGGGRRF